MNHALGQKLGQALGQRLGKDLCPDQPLMRYQDATFTNTSRRMLDYPAGGFPSVAHFDGGTLATRRIQGKLFSQIETSNTNRFAIFANFRSAWCTNFNSSITPATIDDPMAVDNGEIHGDKLVEDSNNSLHTVYETITPDGSSQYVLSVYAKADTRSQLVLSVSTAGFPDASWAWFNLSTEATSKGAGADYRGIEDCGNGWHRCWMAVTSDAAVSSTCSVMLHNGVDTTYQGDGSSGLYIWGYQLEIDYNPSSPILTAHNGLTYSEQLDHANWTKSADASVTANAAYSPIMTYTADKLYEDVTVGDSTYTALQNYTPDGFSNYVFSVYAKASERHHIYLSIGTAGFATAPTVYYDLSDGTVGTESGSPVSTDIVDIGNGWYKCSVVALSDAAAATPLTIGLATDDNDPDYQGDGSSGVYLWGMCMEAASWQGTYYITTTTGVSLTKTRAKDELYWPSADVPPSLRGKITFGWVPYYNSVDAGTWWLMEFADSGASERIFVRFLGGSDKVQVYNNNTTSELVASNVLTFSRGDLMYLTIDPAAGSITVRGASAGDGTVVGTAWSTTEGDVWVAQSKNQSFQGNSLISEPY